MHKFKLILCIVFGLFLIQSQILGQSSTNLELLKSKIQVHPTDFMINSSSVKDLKESYSYYEPTTGLTYCYIYQSIDGIEIQNTNTTFIIDQKGKIHCLRSNFVNLDQLKINKERAALTPLDGVFAAAAFLNIAPGQIVQIRNGEDNFNAPALSLEPIQVKNIYNVVDDQVLKAYQMTIHMPDRSDIWTMNINSANGDLIQKVNNVIKCSFDNHQNGQYLGSSHTHTERCISEQAAPPPPPNAPENSTYNAYRIPIEAPSFGNRTLINSPYDINASPYGWHDLDGADGTDNTTLFGNNVYAFVDANGDYNADFEISGGTDLVFNFGLDFEKNPEVSDSAAATNLFYMNNIMHDMAYVNGFNEIAGNYQLNNYNKGGQGNDNVNAIAQFSNGTTEKNNADFLPTPDGQNGRMRMFLWDNGGRILSIKQSDGIPEFYDAGQAEFGPAITTTKVEGQAIYLKDAIGPNHYGCGAASNSDQFEGKMVLIDRGDCTFSDKVYKAQQYGAIGVIIMNFEEQIINMAAGDNAALVTIPSLFVSKTVGDKLKSWLEQGIEVTIKFQLPPTNNPVTFLDASLDNGIIAHEYAHGITNRLTGGPSTVGCLNNDEQMGEGWSDFFSLFLTRPANDDGAIPRGIGTYAMAQAPSSGGIRRYPYTTDMSINPYTMESIVGTSGAHALGEIWASVLWDLFWKMIEAHGDDGQLYGGNGGNSKAIRLVMEGLKIQPCSPGFLDGRDAILKADEILFNSENKCLIWEVFARRGMGYSAFQGTSSNRNDNINGFDELPICANKIIIEKTMTDVVDPDSEIDVTITLKNYKPNTSYNVLVQDEINNETSYIIGSGGTLNGNKVEFRIDSMSSLDTKTFTYKVKVNSGIRSNLLYVDKFETDDINKYFSVSSVGSDFSFAPNVGQDGTGAFSIANTPGDTRAYLSFIDNFTIPGNEPMLVVRHSYFTQTGVDGGNIRYSLGDDNFIPFKNEIIRGKYTGNIPYLSFGIPNQSAFSGNSNGYINTFIDIKNLKNNPLNFGFFFGASDNAAQTNGYWTIDNMEIVEPKFINSEVCVSSTGNLTECIEASDKGTYVNHINVVKNKVTQLLKLNTLASPNPGNGKIFIQHPNFKGGQINVKIYNAVGSEVFSKVINTTSDNYNLDIASFESGVYYLYITSNNSVSTIKYIKVN